MESNTQAGRSYWDHLGAAMRALETGDLPEAERQFELSLVARNQSPGRVFLTEKITDGLTRLIKGRGTQTGPAGRWSQKSGDFRRLFLDKAERVVREAVRLAELRPEDDAEANQPVLESALFLVGRSRLFSEEPASAVPLLKGVFRTASKTGHPFDAQLIRHDIPLTEEDRLWLARKGPDLLDEFVANGTLVPGTVESQNWVQIILQLLHPRYFGSTSRLEEERAWLEAVTTDRMLQQPDESISLYRIYLEVNPEPGPRPDEARVRLLELLANTDGLNFPVPRYDEALQAMQSAGLAPGSQLASRFQLALEQIEFRRPEADPGAEGMAWASVGVEPDGQVAVVFWWKDQPRDVAFWKPGQPAADLMRFLEPCQGRIVAQNASVLSAVDSTWEDLPARWSVRDFAVAFLEPALPESGVDQDTLLKIGLGESGPWRDGWQADLGHGLLDPPRRSALLETWQGGSASGALLGGLVWLAILARVSRSDPSLRAGIGELARRGDPASGCVYDFLNFDQGLGQTLDASFEPWTLPLLWTRPDPFGWAMSGGGGAFPGTSETDVQTRPDLGHNNLSIVTCGDAGPVLTAWGQGQQKWRIVLDRVDRLGDLARVAAGAIGPVTLIPGGGQVHALKGSLDLLESMLQGEARPQSDEDGLLPLFHWLRLVESHNGDLLDFLQVRPRGVQGEPLYERYREAVSQQELVPPALEVDDQSDPWAIQFAQRVRKAGLVAGLADSLTLDAPSLDSLWGVFEGSDASWVFLDSGAIHWYLLSQGGMGIQELHALLHSRGSRHLSLLTGAVWMRSDLEELLGTWLKVFGRPYCLALTNVQPPQLRLADQGVVPHARYHRLEAHAQSVAQVSESIDIAGAGTVLLPGRGSHAELWRRIASGEIPLGRDNWHFLHPDRISDTALPGTNTGSPVKLLLVPILDSLADDTMPLAERDDHDTWARSDRDRGNYLLWRRRLVGLEFASLLAGPWETVEVMDCRWWRILELEGNEQVDHTSWSGEHALALAEAESCRLFSLPGSRPGKGGDIHANILAAVRHWLDTQALVAPPHEDKASHLAPEIPGSGQTVLWAESPQLIWSKLFPGVARSWEKGHLDQWLLLVSDTLPAEAAAEVAAGYSPGVSVWTAERVSKRPAPVLWCRPVDLEDPDLVSFLKAQPCALALALGVQEWLPDQIKSGQAGALALRTLLDNVQGQLVLQANNLTPAWQDFLTTNTGAQPRVSESGENPPPSRLFADEDESALTPAFPDSGEARTARVVVRRMRGLLKDLRVSLDLPSGQDGSSLAGTGNRLVSLDQLAWLAGLKAKQIESCTRLLRWVARLSGDSLSDASSAEISRPSQGAGHTLLISRRYAELENELVQLEQQVAVLFPLLLGDQRPGVRKWIDLALPPVDMSPAELQKIDVLLASRSCSQVDTGGLIYSCPRGALDSNHRLVGTHLPADQVLANIQKFLSLFRNRLADIMSSALETGEGFLVQTGLDQLRPDEQEFLALGSALGYWIWSGPGCPNAVHLVDLLTVADSSTVKQGKAGWRLLEQELEGILGAMPNESSAEVRQARFSPAKRRFSVGGIKALLPGRDKSVDLDNLVTQVFQLANPEGKSGQLVVTGMAGTGRLEGVVDGLRQAQSRFEEIGEVTVFAPDVFSASHFMQHWHDHGPVGTRPRIQVVSGGKVQIRPLKGNEILTDASQALVIMLEMHRFDPEVRYQIAQQGRGRRLLMITDPAAACEPWEHLFLTVPRGEEVIRMQEQRGISKKVWSEILGILPDSLEGRAGSLADRKGQVEAVYAVNLDQCLARMVQEVEAGTLHSQFRLVGPLLADLDFLATALRQQGWLAIPEDEMAELMLPGPREFMMATVEVLGQLGYLTRYYSGSEDMGERKAPEVSRPQVQDWNEMLPRILGPQAEACFRENRDLIADLTGETSLPGFYSFLESQLWFQPVLADELASVRVRALMQKWSDLTLAQLVDNPLWEAWWYAERPRRTGAGEMNAMAPDSGRRRPLVLLGAADRPGGAPQFAGVYLCLGSELPRHHYSVLSRMTDQILILYKEKSPLARLESP